MILRFEQSDNARGSAMSTPTVLFMPAIIHVAVAEMDATYGAYVAA